MAQPLEEFLRRLLMPQFPPPPPPERPHAPGGEVIEGEVVEARAPRQLPPSQPAPERPAPDRTSLLDAPATLQERAFEAVDSAIVEGRPAEGRPKEGRPADDAGEASRESPALSARDIARLLHSPQRLREAILINEILQPPLSRRPNQKR